MLQYQSALAGSPIGLFLQQEGVFLVRIQLDTTDGSDYHTVTFHARTGRVLHNEPYAKVPVVMYEDRQSNQKALQVFRYMFPRALKIYLRGVWRASRLPQEDQNIEASLLLQIVVQFCDQKRCLDDDEILTEN